MAEVKVTKWAGGREDQRKGFHEVEVKRQKNSNRGSRTANESSKTDVQGWLALPDDLRLGPLGAGDQSFSLPPVTNILCRRWSVSNDSQLAR